MKFLKQDITQWNKALGRAVWFLGEHAFLTTVVLVLLAAGAAAALFYQYVIFSPQGGAEAAASEFGFQEELFYGMLEQLEEESERLESADLLQPRDVFNP